MKYKNPYYKKTKRAFDMMLSCNYCGKDIASYRKKGKGGLLRLWIDRMPESEFKVDLEARALACPFCQEILADLVKLDGAHAYKVHRSALGTRRID